MNYAGAAPSLVAPLTGESHRRELLLWAVLTAVAYQAGARLGVAFTIGPEPIAVIWPPNAILLAALLLAPVRSWPILLLAVLPAHLVVELRAGVPLSMVLSWYVSNCSEALIGAALTRWMTKGPVRLESVRVFGIFLACAVFFAAFASSFIDAGFVVWNAWGASGFWDVWLARFTSNVLANLTIVPIILGCNRRTLRAILGADRRRHVEGAALALSLLLVCAVAFTAPSESWNIGPALLYAPLPLLLWAALRFGMVGVNSSLLVVTIFAISGVMRGHGPFAMIAPEPDAVAVQLFLLAAAAPLMVLVVVIEERRRAENVVRESQRLLALAIAGANIGTWSADLQTGEVLADDTLVTAFGVADVEGRQCGSWLDRMFPDDASRARSVFKRACESDAPRDARGDSPLPEMVYRILHDDGSTHWILSRGVVLRQEDDTPYRATGIGIDITARQIGAQAQRESDERMALVAATANIGFWSYEVRTDSVWLSEHCYTLLDLDPDIHDARSAFEHMSRFASARVEPNPPTLLHATLHTEHEFAIAQSDGAERWLMVSTSQVRTPRDDSTLVVGVLRDVTAEHRAKHEARERQEELAHLARVAMMGDMSATVVHELGQPLNAVALNAQAALRLLGRDDASTSDIRATLHDIERDTRRAGMVIGQFRHLLRRDETTRMVLDVRQLIREVLEIAHSELVVAQIDVSLGFDVDAALVMGNKSQLEQVLLNIILNARDAMSDVVPGLRHLRVSVTHGDDATVRVSFADSGSGIASSRLAHLFEPFFTSKDHGLGLGLAISRTIMLKHGGDLHAENGKVGAVMHLTFPDALRSSAHA